MRVCNAIHLLEDLAIGPLIGLAFDLDRLVPGPLVVDELLVLGWVKLGEFVGLIVGCYVESWKGLVTTDEEDSTDDGVVGLAVYGHGSEEVLAGSFETSEETT
jgi:hypothetical protein